MKLLAPILSAVLLLLMLSCTRDTNYTLSAFYDDKILVAQDKETLERLIDCSITRKCQGSSVMKLLPEGKVFFVHTGTQVVLEEGLLSFTDVRRIHILDGPHAGQVAWAYDRMLFQDEGNRSYQLAFTSISRVVNE